jgi:hypothetical protein
MSSRTILLPICLVMLLLICLVLLGYISQSQNVKFVAQRLVASIPLRSTPAQVLKSLDERHLEHSEYVRNALGGGYIHAMIRDRRGDLVETDYSMTFCFNRDGRLTASDLKPVYTGP